MLANIRSLIFKLDPETAHNLAIKSLKFNFVPNILDDDKDVDISENMNCGCGNTPCDTYGEVKVITVREMAYEETQKFLSEALAKSSSNFSTYSPLINAEDSSTELKRLSISSLIALC